MFYYYYPVTLGDMHGETSTDHQETSPLGPLLPYHEADEDLLLNVMITRQVQNNGYFVTISNQMGNLFSLSENLSETQTDIFFLLVSIFQPWFSVLRTLYLNNMVIIMIIIIIIIL